jgi:hypothetical protein
MASTYSSNLKLQLMGTGDNAGAWGNVTNVNLGTALEESIVGSADVSFSSGDVTLSLTDDNATQPARNLRLNLTGTSGGARVLNVPAIEKLYIVNNGLADACTVKVSGQTGVSVPAGKTMILYNNSTDVVNAIDNLAGLTVVGTSMATSQAFVGSIADTTYSGGIINLSNTSRSIGITADPNNSGASSIINFSVDGSEAMRIDSEGDVGIGGAAPSGYRFEVTQSTAADLLTRTYNSDTTSTSDIIHQYRVNNDAANIYIQFGDAASASSGGIRYNHADDSMRFTTNALDNFRMEADGDFHADGDVVAFSTTVSDERLKEDIKVVDSALDKVKQLRGVTFKYKTDGKVSAGVIAQDVEKVLPEAVIEKELPLKQDDGQAYKTVRYDALHALLIEAVKELSDEVARLKEGK